MPALEVRNVSKAYKRYPNKWARLREWATGTSRHEKAWILQDIDFSIAAGEAVGIIGINGAGKSTLLKIITGTTQPTTGSVHVRGRIAALLELGMGFHADFTGRQNAYMAGQLLGYGVDEIDRLMPEIEQFANIGDYIDRPVRVYSSGMQVRLAFSVATAVRPDILIVDEALSVGDIFFQQKCFDRIRDFREKGTTLLFVSHAMEAVYALCDRAILLSGGRIEMLGKPKQVIDFYNARLALASNSHRSPGADPHAATQIGEARDGSYGNSGVEVQRVRLTNAGGECQAVIANEVVTLGVQVGFLRAFDDPHIGFQVKNSRGEPLYMSTTAGLGRSVGPVQAGQRVEVDFAFRARLAPGDYTITVGVADQDLVDGSFRTSLARRQNAASLTVVRDVAGERWAGLFDLTPTCAVRNGAPLPSLKILATTSQSLLALDLASGERRAVHSGEGLYYGLAKSREHVFVAARRRMVSSDRPASSEEGVIHVFDHALNHLRTVVPPFPLRDLHGIDHADGELWMTCSFDDMVAIWDGEHWRQWYPLGEPRQEPRDVHHFNSIRVEGGRVWLVAHNRGDSELLAFDRSSLELVERHRLGVQAHDLWWEGGALFTCSSGEGRVVGTDGSAVETGHFPRGYLRAGGHRLIGLSALAERHMRDLSTCLIRCHDEHWKPVGEIVLEGEGLLLALLLLDSPSDAPSAEPRAAGAQHSLEQVSNA